MTRRLPAFVAVFALFAVPATASAADTTLTLNGPAAKSLKSKGVKIYEQLPARGAGSRIEFPVSGGTIATKATINHQGALRFKRGSKRLTLKSVRVVIGTGAQSVSAVNGSKRVTIFSIKNGTSTATLNKGASTAKLSGGKLSFTGAAKKLLGKKLGKKPAKGSAGMIKVDASITVEPPVLARPVTAVNISGGTVTWHVKESFANYVAGGNASGDGTSASNGAVPGAADPNSGVVYDYNFPVRAGGWYDPASGTADVLGQGTVSFKYKDHGINISSSNPEIELNGVASRGIFRFGDGKRAVLFNLASTNPPASPFAMNNITATVPAGTSSSVFAGFYQPGENLGYVNVSFTT